MLIQNGHQQLQDFTNKNYEQTITEVTKGVWFVLGLGHSNAIFIEAGSSVILIDTLDTRERGEKLLNLIRQNTQKEVGTIIYTHGHPDHRGGAGAFMDSRPEVIAFAPAAPALEKTGLLQDHRLCAGGAGLGKNRAFTGYSKSAGGTAIWLSPYRPRSNFTGHRSP